jgi:hypothetical protein
MHADTGEKMNAHTMECLHVRRIYYGRAAALEKAIRSGCHHARRLGEEFFYITEVRMDDGSASSPASSARTEQYRVTHAGEVKVPHAG